MASNAKDEQDQKPEILKSIDLETGQAISRPQSGLLARNIFLVGGSVAVLVAMMIVVINVVGRAVFKAPVWGSVEMVGLCGIILAPFAICFTELVRGHITVDLITHKLSRRVKSLFTITWFILSIVIIGILVWGGYQQIIYIATTSGSYTPDLEVPILPFKIVWVIEVVALLGCLIWNLVQELKRSSAK
jgi:TRAP-type C4-dicarboxylate transport system permease small subunit